MIDGKPNYTRLSTIAMADVVLMDPEGRNQFIYALCEMFENILDPDYQPEEKPGFVGRAISRQFTEFREGTKKYMENVYRNPSGLPNRNKNPEGNPVGNPVAKSAETPTRKEKEQEKEQEQETEKSIGASTEGGGGSHKKRFTPPSVEEVRAYCRERNNLVDPEQFCDYYTARGWELKPGQKMKDWRASVRYWERNQKGGGVNGLSGSRAADRVPGQRDLYKY